MSERDVTGSFDLLTCPVLSSTCRGSIQWSEEEVASIGQKIIAFLIYDLVLLRWATFYFWNFVTVFRPLGTPCPAYPASYYFATKQWVFVGAWMRLVIGLNWPKLVIGLNTPNNTYYSQNDTKPQVHWMGLPSVVLVQIAFWQPLQRHESNKCLRPRGTCLQLHLTISRRPRGVYARINLPNRNRMDINVVWWMHILIGYKI